ncbi:MAG: prepilin-type N-terminal cleavage/methylation domain-containing protein [Methylobacter sp.]|nr:prepilin-type N-terminal cleavage/methylation domain-containing protein [Methylobacter sp.]
MSGKSQAKGKKRRANYPVLIGASRLKAAAGFTLIEVLIAMTLLSIMVVLLFSSLSICAKSWEQGESKIAEVNEAAVVYHFFQRHLSSAIPLWDDFTTRDGGYAASRPGAGAAAENKDKTFSFQGKKQSLQFVSVFPASARRTGMQLFSIETQQQDGEQHIKVTLTPFYPVAEGEEWHQEEVVLLKHINDFALAYFGVDDSGEGAWQDQWLEKDAQPRLVKISINTDNGIYWPDMIIALKVAGAGAETDTANGGVSSPDSN